MRINWVIGNKETKGLKDDLKRSCIIWKIPFPKLLKPSKKSLECWKEFSQWLKSNDIITACDFVNMCTSKIQMSEDRKLIKEIDIDKVNYY